MLIDDCIVTVMDFKTTEIHEIVTPNPDGTYSIFLNARDCREKNMESYLHALGHIMNDDFDKFDVQEIETEAHR